MRANAGKTSSGAYTKDSASTISNLSAHTRRWRSYPERTSPAEQTDGDAKPVIVNHVDDQYPMQAKRCRKYICQIIRFLPLSSPFVFPFCICSIIVWATNIPMAAALYVKNARAHLRPCPCYALLIAPAVEIYVVVVHRVACRECRTCRIIWRQHARTRFISVRKPTCYLHAPFLPCLPRHHHI